MNIAIFASAFHPSLGGVEELCRQLAHELKTRGHQVIVLTNRWPRNLPAYELFEGIPLYRVPFRLPGASVKSVASFALTSSVLHHKVKGILRTHATDVVHVQCVSSNAHYARHAAKALGLPLVVTLQGELTMDATQLFQRSPVARRVLANALATADVVTGCSQKTVRDAEQFLDVDLSSKSRAIFNAARTEDFTSADAFAHPRPYLFALGRLVPQKGFDRLIAALAQSSCPHDLLIAGEGLDRDLLEERIASAGLKERVHLVGRADRPEVASYFRGCEFFVLPSIADEGLPVVCAEAMACGKAIVATRSGGAPEAVVHGVNGLIVPMDDVSSLTAALNVMSANLAMRTRMEKANVERAPLFHWSQVTSEYLDAYAQASASRQKHRNQQPDLSSTLAQASVPVGQL